MITVEQQQRINYLRTRSRSGEITLDELKESFALLRSDRQMAMSKAGEKKPRATKSKEPPKSGSDLLGEFANL